MRYTSVASPARFFVLFVLVVLFKLSAVCQSQKAMRQQLTFTCDNNFLLFNGEDGYYTNGVFLRYDRINRNTKASSVKKIFSYEVGQMIYTAHSRKILPKPSGNFPGGIEQIDRPIAGYLFGKALYSSFYHDRSMLGFGVSVGTIGEHSFGRSVQEYWEAVKPMR